MWPFWGLAHKECGHKNKTAALWASRLNELLCNCPAAAQGKDKRSAVNPLRLGPLGYYGYYAHYAHYAYWASRLNELLCNCPAAAQGKDKRSAVNPQG